MSQQASLIISLDPEGDGGAFRIKHAPGEVNPEHLVDRGKYVAIQADLVGVVHGKLRNGTPATLIITDFWFLSFKLARRVIWAQITYKFTSLQSESQGPDVIKVSPQGHFSLRPMQKHVESALKTEVTAQASDALPVSPGVNLALERTESYDTSDQMVLTGTTRMEDREFGGKDTARWALMENRTTKGGTPTYLRTAILLRRKESEAAQKFQATVEIKVNADVKTNFEEMVKKLLGGTPKDDPIEFDPSISSPGFDSFKNSPLDEIDLDSIRSVKTTKVLGDAEHDQQRESGDN
ncbi:hypothetical protein J3F84DRAFT_38040 [Trichoderma pleuroticola]